MCTDTIDFNNRQLLIEMLGDIAFSSGSQEIVTDNLTQLREAAIRAGKGESFDNLLDVCVEKLKTDSEFLDSGIEMRYRYNLRDFTETTRPYDYVFRQGSPFLRRQKLEAIAAEANSTGFKNFKKLYESYVRDMRKLNVPCEGSDLINPCDFPNQPLELECGEWMCNCDGVRKVREMSEEIACRHPIMPVERLVNIDTGEEKLRVAYCKGRYWRDIIVGKKELFDASKVIQLAAVGVSVTSKTARALSEFMCDIEAINYDVLPESECVTRLGYIGDGTRFSPYVEGLTFDGEASCNVIYSAISEHGSYDKWLETAKACREDSLTARIMLAASFASVLIGKIGALSFFVHLWGVESGTGKTVALMLAASVWGNPAIGQYIQTFNATQVGHEKTAAFLNNIPMCIDELQLSKDSHGRSKFDVYQLSQGTGRTRGNKSGGVDRTPTWSLCVLTTGESPLTSDSSGAGAVNRVIDIECRASEAVIKDGISVSGAVRQNYGFAGRKFVGAMDEESFAEARELYEKYFRELSSGTTTEKQAMAAALILTADELADRIIFHSGNTLTAEQISEFLKSKSSVSAGERGYEFMCDWVGMNSNRFLSRDDGNTGDIYGKLTNDGWAYINSTVFRNAAKEQGYDDRALLSWLKTKGLIKTKKKDVYSIYTTSHGVKAQYIVMRLPDTDYQPDSYELL